MRSKAEKTFLKAFSNRGISNPLDREVNDICIHIHDEVKKSFKSDSLICNLTGFDKYYYADNYRKADTLKTFTKDELDRLFKEAEADFVKRVRDIETLFIMAIKKYNSVKHSNGNSILSGFSLEEKINWKFETYTKLSQYDSRPIGYYVTAKGTCNIIIDGVKIAVEDLNKIKW